MLKVADCGGHCLHGEVQSCHELNSKLGLRNYLEWLARELRGSPSFLFQHWVYSTAHIRLGLAAHHLSGTKLLSLHFAILIKHLSSFVGNKEILFTDIVIVFFHVMYRATTF